MRYIILLYCLFCFASLQSQNMSGHLKDSQGSELQYVTVRLLRLDSTFVAGVTTDTLGRYCFEKVQPSDYFLAFSSIGYKSRAVQVKMSDENIELPSMVLEIDNMVLGEVVVKGSSFIRKDDHVLVIPDKQQVKHASTGHDLLYNLMIPSIDVNKRTGTVSTFGGEVSLYINGEKADYRDVQSLRPRDIENVEYYDVPTGKYANDVAAINYITKQYERGGYIALDGKQNIGYLEGDYNVGAKMNYKHTTYSLWAGYNNQKYGGVLTEKHEEINFPDYTVNRDRSTGNATTRTNQQYAQFKVNNKTKKRNLSAQLSFVRNDAPENGSNDMLIYSGHYDRKESSFERTVSEGIQPSMKLFGNFNLPKKQNLEFTLEGAYAQNNYTRTYTEGERQSLTDADEDMYSVKFSGKYNIALKHHNTFGIYGFHLHKITSSSYSGDSNSWQHLWSGETLLFLNYTQRFGKKVNLVFSPGFSLLTYKLHHKELQDQYSFRLKSNVVYRISKAHQMVFAANIGNNTPNISYINDRDQVVDFLQVKRGNPILDNTKLYSGNIIYSGGFGRLNLQAVLAYELSQHAVFSDYYIEEDKLISSYRSDANVHGLISQLNLAYRFSDNLRAKLSGSYVYMTLPDLSLTNNCYMGSFDVNYYWKDFSASLYADASTSRLEKTLAFVKNPVTYGASVSWSHKGWYIEAGTENPFTKHSHYRKYADYGVYRYNQVQTSRIYQQTGYVKLAYTFDFGRKTSRDKDKVDRSINSAIMKVN